MTFLAKVFFHKSYYWCIFSTILRHFILVFFSPKVAKQWFDFDRNTFSFIKKVKTAPQTFTYTSDFDDNGILYWIGTNARYYMHS